jgi:membrane-associated phospholipid phosphatase
LKKTDLSFFIPLVVFILAGLALMLFYNQKEIFFAVNTHYTAFLDYTLEPYTNVGDGITAITIGVFLILFTKIRHGLAFLLACALEGILVQVLKRYIFTGRPRPWAFYSATDAIHLVKNFVPFINNSFPSGHTATAFCMAAMLAMIWPRLRLGWLFFILALLVAYSRIYLSQHYFIDIYVGSIIGTASAVLVYYFFYRVNLNFMNRFHRLNEPLLHFKR